MTTVNDLVQQVVTGISCAKSNAEELLEQLEQKSFKVIREQDCKNIGKYDYAIEELKAFLANCDTKHLAKLQKSR